MTSEQIAELRRLAEAATLGPWKVVGGDDEYCTSISGVIGPDEQVNIDEHTGRGDFSEKVQWIAVDPGSASVQVADNFDFIAACNPVAILSLLDALDAARKERQWQPIETAPKDGRNILTVMPSRGGDLTIGIGHFTRSGYYVGHRSRWTHEPTHWQPLPPPPDAEGGK